MNIAIFGSARSGKSTLAKMISLKYPHYHIIIGDDVRGAFQDTLPQNDINSHGGRGMIDDFPRFLSAYFYRSVRRNRGIFNYVVETCDMHPEKAKQYFSREDTIIIYLATPSLSASDHFKKIRKYETEKDWTYGLSDEEIMEDCQYWVNQSKMFEQECQKLGIMFVDTSKNRKLVLEQTIEELEKIVKKRSEIMTCFEELKERGLIKDISSPEVEKILNGKPVTFYIGTDPTADSLHIGHLSSFLICKRLADYGHKPIILVGGATGMIGDPRPSSERPLITKEEVKHNFECLKKQLEKLFPGVLVVDNYEWSKNINFLDYLRDYGKYFNINYMINKDIIRRRLDDGITYTEFSYMIMQALDFLHLYENNNCIMQVAGQDQWGNITSGIELIRKRLGKEAYAFTMPLVTKKDGTKFGKSEKGALWLDKEKTSPYELFQFFLNAEDEMVIPYLKIYTFLSLEEIAELEKKHKEKPELREAAKTLAYEVVKFLHGKDEADKAKQTSEEVFGNRGISDNMPTVDIAKSTLEKGITLVDFLAQTSIAPSKSEARRLIVQGGISINQIKQLDPNFLINNALVSNNTFVIQKGKKNFWKANIIED